MKPRKTFVEAIKTSPLNEALIHWPDDTNELAQPDQDGNTALHYAAEALRGEQKKSEYSYHYEPNMKFKAIVKTLIEANPTALTVKNDAGISPNDILQDLLSHLPRNESIGYFSGSSLAEVIKIGLAEAPHFSAQSTHSGNTHHVDSTAAIMSHTNAKGQHYHFESPSSSVAQNEKPSNAATKKLSQEEQGYVDKITKTLSAIEIAANAYKKSHPLKAKHGKEFDRLIKGINDILNSQYKSKIQQFQEMVELLETNYRIIIIENKRKDRQHNNQPMDKVCAKIHGDTIEKLNSKQKGHHFTRVVCLALKELYNNGQRPLYGYDQGGFNQLGAQMFDNLTVPNNKKIYAAFDTQQEPARTNSLKM